MEQMFSTSKLSLSKPGPLTWLLLLTTACLVPFLGKAFHVDDTLFLRAGEQIQRHPLDFYGFQLNWSGSTRPMVDNFDNPPLTCYYIAGAAGLLGWTEPALHLAFLLPALAAACGIFWLARHYCERPWLAGIVAILTPVYIISATSVMCDVMLLAFWVWSIACFEKGLNSQKRGPLLISGALIGLGCWTKFTALALVPLLAIYGLCRKRQIGWWAAALLVPLLFAGAYEYITFRLYGKGLFLTAASFSTTSNTLRHGQFLEKEALGLSFMGGCFMPVLFYAPWLWSRSALLKGLCIVAPFLLVPLCFESWHRFLWDEAGGFSWLMFLQSGVFLAAGVHIFAVVIEDFWTRRDARSLLLGLWVLGVFVFATRINWTINGRSFLPMLPAVGILAARRFEQRRASSRPIRERQLAVPALIACALCLFLAAADEATADGARIAARRLCGKYRQGGRLVWFQGHWGFQYYMEQLGGKPFERTGATWNWGDFVIIPVGAVNSFELPDKIVRQLEIVEYPSGIPCSIMSRATGAAFYASVWGPLPYSIGSSERQRYQVLELTQK